MTWSPWCPPWARPPTSWVGLAAALNDNPPLREMDRLLSTGEQVSMSLLAMAIEARGYKAMSFTGRQAGIETDKFHNKAKIVMVHSERVRDALERGAIAVVAGFQGVDADGDITTLGRGGSDTTAVAVAHGLNADVCEIYSDVDGVYTADRASAAREEARRHQLRRYAGAFRAPAPASCRCAPSSSPASTTWSSIPVRRSPTPRAPMSRRKPT